MMDDEGDDDYDDDYPPCHDKYCRSILCVSPNTRVSETDGR